MSPGQGDEVTREVNMTPLIDVSLVLVVMLLLMTPLALESSFSVRSASESGRTEAQDEVERVELRILSDTEVRINQESVGRADVKSVLAPLLGGESPATVVVSAEEKVAHGVFVEVIDTAKSAGATEIALIGR